MLKFLRKYNKWILVVGGSLLMVAFTAPQAVQQLGAKQEKKIIATLGDGSKVRAMEVLIAARELQAVSRLAPLLVQQLGIGQGDKEVHWLLLTRAAEEAGYVGAGEDPSQWFAALAQPMIIYEYQSNYGQYWQYFIQQDPQQFQERIEALAQAMLASRPTVAAQFSLTLDQLDLALSKARGAARMIDALETAPRFSDRRAIVEAATRLDTARLETMFIPASIMLPEVAEPSEDELRAFYDSLLETRPVEGEFGIGYLLPPRIRAEWIELNPQTMIQDVPLDRIEVRKRYSQMRAEYPGEFEDERPRVEQALRGEMINDVMQAAVLSVTTEIRKWTRRLEDDGDYKKLPDDWRLTRPDYAQIAEAVVDFVKDRTGVTIAAPEVHAEDEAWMNQQEFTRFTDFAMSEVRIGTLRMAVRDAVMQVRELGGNPVLRLQVGVPSVDAPARSRDGRVFFYTVTAARGESAPESFEGMRDRVLDDYKRVKAYGLLRDVGDDYRAMAIDAGLEGLREAVNAPVLQRLADDETALNADNSAVIQANVTVMRDVVRSGDSRLNNETFSRPFIERISGFDPMVRVESLSPDERTLVVPLPKHLGVAIGVIKGRDVVTQQRFRLAMSNPQMSPTRAAAIQEFRGAASIAKGSPFGLEQLISRLGYVPEGRKSAPGDENSES